MKQEGHSMVASARMLGILLLALACRVGPKEESGGEESKPGDSDTSEETDSDSGEVDSDSGGDADTDTDSDADTDTDTDSDTDTDTGVDPPYLMTDGEYRQIEQGADVYGDPWVDLETVFYTLVSATPEYDCRECDFAFHTEWEAVRSDPEGLSDTLPNWEVWLGFDGHATPDEAVFCKFEESWAWSNGFYTGYVFGSSFFFYAAFSVEGGSGGYYVNQLRFEGEATVTMSP